MAPVPSVEDLWVASVDNALLIVGFNKDIKFERNNWEFWLLLFVDNSEDIFLLYLFSKKNKKIKKKK